MVLLVSNLLNHTVIKSALWGAAVNRLVTINVAVFVLMSAGSLLSPSLGINPMAWVSQFALSSNPVTAVTHPWTFVLYMFSQSNVLHLVFNMLWLYCFGRLLDSVTVGGLTLKSYVFGGLLGGVLYVVLGHWALASQAWLMGSSASVIAIGVALAFRVPDMRIDLIILGPVAVKWVVIVSVALFCIGLTGGNVGGNIAHLGGAAVGAFFGLSRLRGRTRAKNITGEFTRDDRIELDRLLDKVKRSGYPSLTAAERRRLFDISGRIK